MKMIFCDFIIAHQITKVFVHAVKTMLFDEFMMNELIVSKISPQLPLIVVGCNKSKPCGYANNVYYQIQQSLVVTETDCNLNWKEHIHVLCHSFYSMHKKWI